MSKVIHYLYAESTKLEKFMYLLTRLAIGLFFAITGYYKLFDPNNKEVLLETFISAGIPFPHFNLIFVPLIEFIGGLFLIFGFATRVVAFAFIILLLVATFTDGIHKIPDGLNLWRWYSYFYYLPEVPMLFILGLIFAKSSGKLSIDSIVKKYQSGK